MGPLPDPRECSRGGRGSGSRAARGQRDLVRDRAALADPPPGDLAKAQEPGGKR